MRIHSIDLQNFRCYEIQHFNFGERTTVLGNNGDGKSTLAEAIIWCLFGTNILGKTKQDENLMRLGANDMAVAVTFVNTKDKQLVVARTRQGKKASFLTVNGLRPQPGEIEGIFGSVSEFLSVFLPGFFSSLEPKDAKAILAKCVPEVPKEEVLSRMSPEEAELLARDKFTMGIDSIDFVAKKIRDDIDEFERELIHAEGEMSVYTRVLEEGPPKPFESQVSDADRAEYEAAQREILKADMESNDRESRLLELRPEYARLQQKYRDILKNPPNKETHCYTCGQPLAADKVSAVHEKALREHQDKLAEVVREGQKVRAELERLQQPTNRPILDERLQQLVQRVEHQINSERQLQIEHAAAIKSYQQAKDNISQLEKQIEHDQRNLDAFKRKLKILQTFRFEYVRAQHEKLNGLFENVRIHLVDANRETGEIRESFRIEWKGRPYRLLSFSEKVRCDLEIGRVLSWAKGEEMPVYVDNAESVQNLFGETFGGQVIAAYVADTRNPEIVEDLRRAQANPEISTIILEPHKNDSQVA